MKFNDKHQDAKVGDTFDFEYTFVTKTRQVGLCGKCSASTRWLSVGMDRFVCSEECHAWLWGQYRQEPKFRKTMEELARIKEAMTEEMRAATLPNVQETWKDILVVVHNQLEFFKICVESLLSTTQRFNLLVWDNASDSETQAYLQDLQGKPKSEWTLRVFRSEENIGFIEPNNRLAKEGNAPYLICLNSDTKVFPNWDTAMIGCLSQNSDVGQVGFWGGHLDSTGRGFGGCNGYDVDYIPGWCFCISRDLYQKIGLFDSEHLRFAYSEDADLSLRIQEHGKRLYALYSPLLYHFQNKTIIAVEKEGRVNIEETFKQNHEYLARRWRTYLESQRVLARQPSNVV